MQKIILQTVFIYILFEIICHAFAFYVTQFFKKAVPQDESKPKRLEFIKQTFYRLMLIFSIIMMNHIYTEIIFFEKNQYIVYMWSGFFIVFILLFVWTINAYMIRTILISKQNQHAVINVNRQKISYIMRHPKEFLDIYVMDKYLNKSRKINYLLSFLAFIFLFLDIQSMS